MSYRRICDNEADSYIWMEAKKYIDETENIAILTLHNAKVIPDTIVNMEQELRKKEKNITKQYWDMVSLLVAVLNHNNLVEKEHQDDISFIRSRFIANCRKIIRNMELQKKRLKMYHTWHQSMILVKSGYR